MKLSNWFLICSTFLILVLLFLTFSQKVNAYTVYLDSGTSPAGDLPVPPPNFVYFCDADRECCPGRGLGCTSPTGYYSTIGSITYYKNLDPCIKQGTSPNNVCCTSSGGCTFTDRSPVPQWTFSYAASCTVTKFISSDETGQLQTKINYTYNSCTATDTCFSPPQGPYFYATICNANAYDPNVGPTSACVQGGIYKVCCYSNGTVDAACSGGVNTGVCTSPSFPVVCGVDQATCDNVIAQGGKCTTAPCGSGSDIGVAACAAVAAPPPKYSCKSADGTCQVDPNGPFTNNSTCNNQCTGGLKCTAGATCPAGCSLTTFSNGNVQCFDANNNICQTTCKTLPGCEKAPTYSPPKNTPATVIASCNPTATSCTAPCNDTCTDNRGQTCPATRCVSVWGCQNGVQWYNSGKYYSSCPGSCSAPTGTKQICVPGSSQVVCDQTTCQVPPGQ